ncbi:hypothetical protein KSP39_PZI000335 [Platanthera zijinensis]|uniref:Polyprotein n=1 Tax=Platanthera zijinensis TaxID=2320716 RepID=A0AAP0GG76_9ASPA
MEDKITDIIDTVDPCEAGETPDQPPPPPQGYEIGYHALIGTFSSQSIRFEGFLLTHPVQILVDCDSSTNFISQRVASFLRAPITVIKPFKVHVGNRELLTCAGIYLNTKLTIQKHNFSSNLFVLDLYGSDIVLGMVWLESLGNVTTNYRDKHMSFQHTNQTICLQGIQPIVTNPITPSQINKLVSQDSISSSVSCFFSHQTENQVLPIQETDHPDLTTLLSNFKDVFQKPTGLPPSRDCDHKIPLQTPGTIIKVRPYCYPHYQKMEIDRLVEEMLAQGLIRLSSLPFSSPVLLIKKDGT